MTPIHDEPRKNSSPKHRLRQLLDTLETAVESPAPAQLEIGSWSNDEIALAFHLQLCTLLRRGPSPRTETRPDETSAPYRLLLLARQATRTGQLRVADLAGLIRLVEHLEEEIRASGAWDRGVPLWWAPLPKPDLLEEIWKVMPSPSADGPQSADEQRAVHEPQCADEPALPSRKVLRQSLAQGTPQPWLAIPRLLAPSFARQLHGELESAFLAGYLDLEAAGVGVEGKVSSRRTDWVRYLTGTEPELIAAAPTLAVLAQWGLETLGDHLGSAWSDRPPASPQTVMLARYPAPSQGFHPHLDNPGGPPGTKNADNGRSLTLVLYLNSPEQECEGGEIALWNPDQTGNPGQERDAEPAIVFPANSGFGVLFNSRTVPHQVRAVQPGPARWALTFWFNDSAESRLSGTQLSGTQLSGTQLSGTQLPNLQPPTLQPPTLQPLFAPPPRKPSVAELLLPLSNPPLPANKILFHFLEDQGNPSASESNLRILEEGQRRQRVGIVSTVYRGGKDLDAWCAYHLSLGFDHLLLIFDHPSESQEQLDMQRLRQRFPATSLTLWSGEDLGARSWPGVDSDSEKKALESTAREGGSSYAVACRQTLNASEALAAARESGLGGQPLDWLLHLDNDEFFRLEGSGRGGESLHQHFSTVTAAGWNQVRYANHELLPSSEPGKPRYKVNPRLAAEKLGSKGWQRLVHHLRMEQSSPRPYFVGYHNGKAAIAVRHGSRAAGVHRWALREGSAASTVFLAGPSVLHHQIPDQATFARKYLSKAASPVPPEGRPFAPSPLEQAALDAVQRLRDTGAGEGEIREALGAIYQARTSFSAEDVALLEEAGLLFEGERLEDERLEGESGDST